ncbi:MAG: B12-binding domain-containing protein [Actinomycetota bacterium]|nr:B12-binding domain-containing protein [Actinomycetota bacterium]
MVYHEPNHRPTDGAAVSTAVHPPPLDGQGGARIADVARVLGVPMPTSRSWELRYGIPALSRSTGQHRRYLPAEIHALRFMRDEIARGSRASTAARSVQAMLDGQAPAQDLIALVLAAVELLDAPCIRARLDDAAAQLGLAGCLDDVLLPAMRQVGLWWAEGHCDVLQERMATEAVCAWLDRRSAFAPVPSHRSPVLLACGPSDLHTVGLESMALLLRHQGWSCRVLGARTATVTLATAARASAVAAVIVVSHLATGRRRAVESICAVDELGIAVFFAGNAFSTPRTRRGVPGSYLGTGIHDACALLTASLDPSAAPAADRY